MIARLAGIRRFGRAGGSRHRCRRGRLSRLLLVAHDRAACRRLASAVRLLIETHVREDHIHLYGFVDAAERDWFRLLTTVQGVGARLALAILSAVAPEALALAILAQDKAMLARADGVGPRLATRIVTELRDKVGGFALAPARRAFRRRKPRARRIWAGADAVSALVNLGYRRAEALGAVAAAARRLGDGAALDALIRAGLQELGQGLTQGAAR